MMDGGRGSAAGAGAVASRHAEVGPARLGAIEGAAAVNVAARLGGVGRGQGRGRGGAAGWGRRVAARPGPGPMLTPFLDTYL